MENNKLLKYIAFTVLLAIGTFAYLYFGQSSQEVVESKDVFKIDKTVVEKNYATKSKEQTEPQLKKAKMVEEKLKQEDEVDTNFAEELKKTEVDIATTAKLQNLLHDIFIERPNMANGKKFPEGIRIIEVIIKDSENPRAGKLIVKLTGDNFPNSNDLEGSQVFFSLISIKLDNFILETDRELLYYEKVFIIDGKRWEVEI